MRSAIALASLFLLVIASPFVVSAADGDGDGIDDALDMCPYAAGTANSTLGNGCPDSDGDGQADFEQAITHDWNEAQRVNTETGYGGVEAMEWAKNGTVFYAGGDNSGNVSVHIFNSRGNPIGILCNMTGGVNVIEQSPDETMIGLVSDDGGAKVVNSTTGSLIIDLYTTLFSPNNETENAISMSWSNDGARLFLSSGQGKVSSVWTNNWTVEWNQSSLPSWVGGIDTTPDDRMLFVSSGSLLAAYWIGNFTEAWTMTNHSDHIRIVTVSPDGRFLATGSNNNKLVITDINNNTKLAEMDINSDAAHAEFSPDGGTIAVGSRRSSSIRVYETDTWSSLGEIDGFGSSNNNRGVYSLAFDSGGERLAVGWRRGYVSLHLVAANFVRVHGDFSSTLMEDSWTDWYYSNDDWVKVWDGSDRTTVTLDVCDGEDLLGSHATGVSPEYAVKSANYSDTGLWDCKNTAGQILEVPYGHMAGAFSVKAGGETEACLQQIGGLSMGQMRWITSSLSKNSLQTDGEMPGLDFSSIAPNNDIDSIPEWSDIDASCPDEDITLAHRWENRTEMWVIKETLLCENCVTSDYIYPSSNSRYRADVGEYKSDVLAGVTGPTGEGSIAYTELGYTLDNPTGLYVIPIVDNFTHGASDAIAAGQLPINATRNNSRDDTWPVQTDVRMFMSTDAIDKNLNFSKFLLTDVAAIQWELMGFTKLGPWDTYRAWLLLGIDMSHILPDLDGDGVWDGLDICPETMAGTPVDEVGCAEYELDDDNDGFTNDIDDCDYVAGSSNFGLVGCPDSDGDGWADDTDSHPDDVTEWNDTDMDSFGDNSDDCIDIVGNSTEDRLGCLDSDGDGWSDAADTFPDDPTEWVDTDGDGYGDNQDLFPYSPSQWADQDGDGFGDNSSGIEPDMCPEVAGNSSANANFGCPDTDDDGWADVDDALPFNPEQHIDEDGDGYGDEAATGDYDWCIETPQEEITMVDSFGCGPSERDSDYDTFTDSIDQCPNTPFQETAKVDSTGCAPSEIDLDQDGVSSDLDWDDNDPDQWLDSDNDGIGDNTDGVGGDDCPSKFGNSSRDRIGCLDTDGDGWSDETSSWSSSNGADIFPYDKTQWNDSDADGFGDNWDDPTWSESRTLGELVEGATTPDMCPEEYSAYVYSSYLGCLTKYQPDTDYQPSQTNPEDTGGVSTVVIVGIGGGGLVLILIGAIAMLLKKKPKRKIPRPVVKQMPTFDSEPTLDIPQNAAASSVSVTSVSTWEELPPGEWLDPDENGTNWYLDDDGRNWYSDDDGFHVWQQ